MNYFMLLVALCIGLLLLFADIALKAWVFGTVFRWLQ